MRSNTTIGASRRGRCNSYRSFQILELVESVKSKGWNEGVSVPRSRSLEGMKIVRVEKERIPVCSSHGDKRIVVYSG